jgi:5-methylcytosine-specific restriction endonuclease McrA
VTTREVPEWVGKTPDSKIPPRVLLRIYERENGICHGCQVSLKGKRWEADHRPALVNGGENRESKIFPVCTPCHKARTKKDVAEKADISRKKQKNLGIRRPKGKLKSAPFPKPEKERKGREPLPPRKLYQ